jgi:hypothetical protein
VATSRSSATRSTSQRPADNYAPPTPLQDLYILDLLELAGSQCRAGAALSMHQSTVCRSLQLMKTEFRLEPSSITVVCRYGHNSCLHYLRLASREHRLMEGLLRIGTDVLHQCLLRGMAGIQQVPSRFRQDQHWAELVRHGLLDGAVVSSMSFDSKRTSAQGPAWDGLTALPLGQLGLQLVATRQDTRRVLVPQERVMPMLHQAVVWHGFSVEKQPVACQEPAAWLKRAKDRQLAIPICSGLLGPDWLESHNLMPLPDQPALIEQLWLLLPRGMDKSQTARQCLRQLRSRVTKAEMMRDLHEIQC